MTQPDEPLPPFLAESSRLGQEISVTGKWVPLKKGVLFRKSAESREMRKEWEDISSQGSNFTRPGGSMSDGTTM